MFGRMKGYPMKGMLKIGKLSFVRYVYERLQISD